MTTPPLPPILVVEDNQEDFTTLSRAFRRNGLKNSIVRCTDGDEALTYLEALLPPKNQALPPAIILLDLNMPGTDGRTVLSVIKQNPHLQAIPVIVFSTSSNPKDIDECYQLGVNSYLVKPIDYTVLEARIRLLMQYWLDTAELPFKHA
jgi:CheY-like chemotaxis protein